MEIDWRLLGKSVWAVLIAVCVNTILCLLVIKIWQTIVLSRKLTSGYYNDVDYAGLGLMLTFVPFLCVLAIGLPLQALLQKSGFTAWRWYGLSSGLGVATLGFLLTTLSHYQRHPILVWAISFGLGIVFGSIFWLIRRPDKEVAKPLP